MENTDNKSEDPILRKRAVKLLKKKPSKTGSQLSDADILKLIHELEVHQIELELQNQELMLAKEQAAELATEKYIELYDFAPSGYFTLSKGGEIIDLNLSGAKMLGKERSGLKNRPFGFFVTNDTKPVFNQFLEKVFNSNTNETCEVTLASAGNSLTYVHLNGIVTENGEHCFVTVLDITERRHAEEDLRKSEEKYRNIFENVQDVFFQVDLSGDILDISPSIKYLSGFYREEIIGIPISNLFFHPVDREFLLNEIMKKDEFRDYELKLKTRIGDIKYVSINARLISDPSGNPKHIDGAVRDITERILVEKELIVARDKAEESDRLKSTFLANISHEIRTPLNGILGFAELIKAPDLTLEKKQRYIYIIEKSGTRMLSIINDILDISKIELGQVKVFISATNINEQIEDIYAFFKPEVEQKGMQIFFENSLPDKKSIIQTDQEKIYAILTNLVKNAIKFTHKGHIKFGYKPGPTGSASPVTSSPSKKMAGEPVDLIFYVKDTGIGIPPEQLEMIFERFRQGSDLLSRNYEGAGLGLSISKAYVEMLGGKIWAESKPGKGSVFYFTLPYRYESKEKTDGNDLVLDDVAEKKMNKLKILIAEDDELLEKLITISDEKICKEFIKVRTGIEAVEVCRNNPDLDLILMDIKLLEMDGYEATRQIRKFNKDVIIIAQTGFALTKERQKAIESGCDEYISKSIGNALFYSLIKRHILKHAVTK